MSLVSKSQEYSQSNNKVLLMRLRKESGFPFAKCKSALENCHYEIDEAHKLLQKWAKEDSNMLANKLASRSAKEGLLSVIAEGSQAAVLEVNCETDFVSRNEKFQKLALDSVQAIFTSPDFINLKSSEDISDLEYSDTTKLADLKSEVLPLLKENIVFGKCSKIQYEPEVSLFSSVHPVLTPSNDSKAMYGKFVSLVALKPRSSEVPSKIMDSFGKQLAYHVIGMSPETLHPVENEESNSISKVDESTETNTNEGEGSSEVEEDKDEDVFMEEQNISDEQTPFSNVSEALISQNFLFQSEKTVGELCDDYDIDIVNFHRFELK